MDQGYEDILRTCEFLATWQRRRRRVEMQLGSEGKGGGRQRWLSHSQVNQYQAEKVSVSYCIVLYRLLDILKTTTTATTHAKGLQPKHHPLGPSNGTYPSSKAVEDYQLDIFSVCELFFKNIPMANSSKELGVWDD